MSDAGPRRAGFHGPACWAVSAAAGALAGALLTRLLPPVFAEGHPVVPLWLAAPFAALLGSIAVMPFVSPRFWHRHFPDFAFALGALVGAYYVVGYGIPAGGHGAGLHTVRHTLLEYYTFMALVGGLFIVSGGILIDVRGRAGPGLNTAILAVGAVIANVVGTTGASMLLIRPFLRVNEGRLRPIHVVFFIFIVSNCGGALTPIGDPPLYLGFIKGVPFAWTIQHLWPDWLFVVSCLLVAFALVDRRIGPGSGAVAPGAVRVRLRGAIGFIALGVMILGVFLDAILARLFGLRGFAFGATLQLLAACAALRLAPRDIVAANEFTLFPVKEVGLLFLGIFLTMMPALDYLAHHGPALGLTSPTAFYFGTGSLSAVLDNAPTYLNFLQIAYGPGEMSPQALQVWLADPRSARLLHAVSNAAVFFGAMTYIGNGPNFMVKAIAEDAGVRMPSFFGYLVRGLAILLPILLLHWLLFIR